SPAPPPIQVDAPSLLIPEILGFSPQLLLDDLVDAANEVQLQVVEGMDTFLQRWADDRAKSRSQPSNSNSQSSSQNPSDAQQQAEWDATEEVESGIISFQTLLQEHTDIAFDLFEVWTLRNVFSVRHPRHEDLEKYIQLRHHVGVVQEGREREGEAVEGLVESRRKLSAQRALKRTYTLALSQTRTRLARLRALTASYSALDNPALTTQHSIPPQLHALNSSLTDLPDMDAAHFASQLPPSSGPTEEMWEAGETGYLNWAVGQVVGRAEK
ncbi:Mis12 protein-domain-containing protein, partial [Pterulicium gracile]